MRDNLKLNDKLSNILRNIFIIITVITVMLFVSSLSVSASNIYIRSLISSQYKNEKLGALKTNVNETELGIIKNWEGLFGSRLINNETKKDFNTIEKKLKLRDDLKKEISSYKDGNYYVNGVNTKKLDSTDKKLLLEKNQDVFQKGKNKLDNIRLWYDQTQDAKKYIDRTYEQYTASKGSISLEKSSMTNAYFKLIKNKDIKTLEEPKVKEIKGAFKTNQKSKENMKSAQRQQELAQLKNSSLKVSYQPASVDIISSSGFEANANRVLAQRNVTDSSVLFLDNTTNSIGLLNRNGNEYEASSDVYSVSSSQISNGNYSIKSIVNSNGGSDVIDMDSGSSDFGKYISNTSVDDLKQIGITATNNNNRDFNDCFGDVFWLKNNSSLQTAIVATSGNNLVMIYSGASSLDNSATVSRSSLYSLQNDARNVVRLVVG